MKIKNKEKFKFKKGQEVHLDTIYEISGLCGGDWWKSIAELESVQITYPQILFAVQWMCKNKSTEPIGPIGICEVKEFADECHIAYLNET